MSFPDAAAFLMWTSLRNRVRAQWLRLRQPKYLVFTFVGLLYFWRVFFRGGFASQRVLGGGIEATLGAMALLGLVGAWIFGGDEATLRFSEAEIAFFFAGPVSRRGLIHFRLVRQLAVAVLSALLITVLRARYVAHVQFFFAGVWLALAMLSLHTTGAALTRASLAQHGIAGWRRRLLTLAVIAAAVGALAWSAARGIPPLPRPLSIDAARSWAAALAGARPLSWLLYPVTAPLRVAFAADLAEFSRALPGAIVVVLAHYLWAASSSAAFEESSAESAERRARSIEARRGGRRVIRRGRPLFALPPDGARWVAVTWKNLLAGSRVLSLRLILIIAIATVAGAAPLAAVASGEAGRAFVIATSLCAGVAGLLALFGPHVMRSDLRMDLPNMDLLRSYPLNGREVVTASIAAPAFVLVGFEIFFVLLGASLSFGAHLTRFGLAARLSIALVAITALGAFTISGLILRNAVVLILPGWSSPDGAAARGPEAIGQRMLLLVGTLVLIAFGLTPPAIVGGALAWALYSTLGAASLVPGVLAAAALFALEVRLALAGLGLAFERFDLSEK